MKETRDLHFAVIHLCSGKITINKWAMDWLFK